MAPKSSSSKSRPRRRAKATGVCIVPDSRTGHHRVFWRVDGKRLSRTFRSLDAAQAEATAIRDRLREHGRSGLADIDTDSLAELRLIRAAIGSATVAQLLGVWERHKGEIIGGEAGLTLSAAVTRYLALRESEGLTGDSYGHTRKHLGRLVAALGARPLVAVDAHALRTWLAGLKTGGFAAWTLIHHHKSVHALFTRAVAEGWIVTSPMSQVAAPAKPKEEVEPLTADEGARLFAALRDDPVAPRLALEAFGGLRYSGACRLEPDEILWDERAIIIPAAKAKDGKRHYLEKHPANLWSWLDHWRHRSEAWTMTRRQILAAKSAAFARAGVANPGNALRHSFCSYHVALHRDAAATALLMQHTNQAMLYRHYRGVATAADAARWFAIAP